MSNYSLGLLGWIINNIPASPAVPCWIQFWCFVQYLITQKAKTVNIRQYCKYGKIEIVIQLLTDLIAYCFSFGSSLRKSSWKLTFKLMKWLKLLMKLFQCHIKEKYSFSFILVLRLFILNKEQCIMEVLTLQNNIRRSCPVKGE